MLDSEATKLKQRAFQEIGAECDLDSQESLASVVRNTMNLKEVFGAKTISPVVLEELAVNTVPLRAVVKYLRVRKQKTAVDLIIKSVNDGRIYPLFSQIRCPYGALASKSPSLFDVGVLDLSSAFRGFPRRHFRSSGKSLDTLQQVGGDPALLRDRVGSKRGRAFMEDHSVTRNLNRSEQDELLLLIAVGRPDPNVALEPTEYPGLRSIRVRVIATDGFENTPVSETDVPLD